jgi:aspartate dehydrogenase
MKRIGVMGCGRIGGPVIHAIQAGEVGDTSLVAVLARQERSLGNIEASTDPENFFKHEFDLIIDTSTPEGFRLHAIQALQAAEVWTVNGGVLADNELFQSLEQTGRAQGHRLRLLTGAIAGLDGVSCLSVDEEANITAEVCVAPSESGRKVLFTGSARDAARQFPESVNVAVATGLAGTGLDRTQVEVVQPGLDEPRQLGLSGQSKFGQINVTSAPIVRPDKGIHMVAACIIAALRNEEQIIWVG